jgi:hypothetical protein
MQVNGLFLFYDVIVVEFRTTSLRYGCKKEYVLLSFPFFCWI